MKHHSFLPLSKFNSSIIFSVKSIILLFSTMNEQQKASELPSQQKEQFEQSIKSNEPQLVQPPQQIQSQQQNQPQSQKQCSQKSQNETQKVEYQVQQQYQQPQNPQNQCQNALNKNQNQQLQQISQQDIEKDPNYQQCLDAQQIKKGSPEPSHDSQQAQEQSKEKLQTMQLPQEKPVELHQQTLSNNQQNESIQKYESNQEPEQPPQKQSFFQSLLSYFFKPKEVATYPPNFPPPPIESKKTLIFDLDETLIHSSDFPPHPKVESFKIGDPPYYVFKRPGLDDFLRKYSKLFDIFIFTSGYKVYADQIINAICPYLDEQHRLFRNSCTIENNEIHKDLDAFKRPLTDIILVEDNFNLKKVRPNNTIIVQRWEGIPFDTTLIRWLPQILDECVKAKDVRDVISKISDNWHFDRSI